MIRRILYLCMLCLVLVSCGSSPSDDQTTGAGGVPVTGNKDAGKYNIPVFDHVVWIVLENQGIDQVIGNEKMPYLNQLAKENVLLDQYYAVHHPSLPNYLALVGGNTFGISKDCTDCFVKEPNLADRIEAGKRTWKTYQEDMPSACFLGNKGEYMQKHNPFIYFDSVRLDPERCKRSVVPLKQLAVDLAENKLPDFMLISPNMCHSGHDCGPKEVDEWLKLVIEPLRLSPAMQKNSLIAITYDEAENADTQGCCGDGQAGGRVAAVLVSPLAKNGMVDTTPLSHYSLLKTVLVSWNLPDLGETAEPNTKPIDEVWK